MLVICCLYLLLGWIIRLSRLTFVDVCLFSESSFLFKEVHSLLLSGCKLQVFFVSWTKQRVLKIFEFLLSSSRYLSIVPWRFLPRYGLILLPLILLFLQVLQKVMQFFFRSYLFLWFLLFLYHIPYQQLNGLLFKGQSFEAWLLLPQPWQ